MIIDYLGIRLHKLRKEHLEMLRGWRNAKTVRPFMHSKEHISAQMQQNWFTTINNKQHLYLIVEIEDEMIGTIYLKDIDLENGHCEGGILAKSEHISTIAPAIATICMVEITYYLYGLQEMHGHTYKKNTKVISNYKHLGAVERESEFGKLSTLIVMKKAEYEKRRTKLLTAVYALYPSNGEMIITMDQEDTQDEVSNYVKNELIPNAATATDNKPRIRLKMQ